MGKPVCYFLRLRFPGFGGPVGRMVRELVDGKEWLIKEQMREAIAMCQSLPGPLAIQLGICIAYLPARQDDRRLAVHPRRPRVARDSVPHPATGVRVDGAKVTC